MHHHGMIRWVASVCAVAVFGAWAAEAPTLNIYNWNDYVAKDTIANFQKETGIQVKYGVYDSNETLQAKILMGKSGYDIVVPGLEFAGKQIQSNVHLKLDKSKLTNYANLDPYILKQVATADPGNAYLVPYLWGTTAIGINVNKVKRALGGEIPDDAWRLVFDPTFTKKLQSCGISFMDSPSEVFAMVNLYLGKDANDFSKPTLEKSTQQLIQNRKNVRLFNNSPIDLLANGDVCVAIMFSGDAYIAKKRALEVNNGQTIAYIVPKKGAVMWTDNLAIPKDARHPQNALKFINYVLRPQVIAAVTNEVYYANPNLKAKALVDKSIASDPNIYVSEAVAKKLVTKHMIDTQKQRELTAHYNQFKSAK